MIDITSADGAETLAFAKDPARPGYVVLSTSDSDGELPETELGSYRIVDLIRMLEGLVPRTNPTPRAMSRYYEVRS